MPSAWEAPQGEERWSDREAWRGDMHPEAAEPWRLEAGEGWVWAGEDEELDALDLQELDPEPGDRWPEDLAGPEYWLYKRDGM